MGHQAVHFLQAHTLFDRTLHAHQPDTVLILKQLANRADATVAEVVDVVDLDRQMACVALVVSDFPIVDTVAQVDQVAYHFQNVFLGQGGDFKRQLQAQLVVQLEASDRREIVAFLVEEKTREKRIGAFQGRRITGAQATIDFDLGFFGRGNLVLQQGIAQEGPDKHVIDKQDLKAVDPALGQFFELGSGQFFIALDDNFTGRFVNDIGRRDLAEDLFFGDLNKLDLFFFDLADRRLGKFTVGLDQDLAIGVNHLDRGPLAEQKLGVDLFPIDAIGHEDFVGIVEVVQKFFGRIAESFQEHGRRQLAATVDPYEENIFMIKVEIEPGAPIRDHPGAVKHLAARMRLALVMVEKDPGRTMQLTDDDTFCAIDDESTVLGHQWNFAEIDFLLLDVANRLHAGLLVDIPGDQPHLDLHRGGKRHASLVTFLDIVFRRTERVINILQGTGFTKIPDREYRAEYPLNADVLASGRRQIRLQETLIGILLDINKVRDIDNPLDFLKVFPKKLVIRNRISHGVSSF